jgi:hypothetical protein
MCRDRKPAEPVHVVDDVAPFSSQRVWSLREIERHDVPILRADLNGVDVQHAVAVIGQIGCSRPVAVIGDDDELQSGGCCRAYDFLDRAGSVGPRRMHVDDTADAAAEPRRRGRQITRRRRHHREERYRGNDEKGEAPDQAKHGIRLRPRMKTVVHGAHPLLEHVRVDLRRREISMPQHHLNGPQIRAALE